MTKVIKLKLFFSIVMVLLLCETSTLFAQNDCDSLSLNEPLLICPSRTLPLNVEEEEEMYKNYSPVIIPEYFLLGAFNGGPFNTHSSFNDTFQSFEKGKLDFLQDYIQQHFNINIFVKDVGESKFYEISSKELATILNKYFNSVGQLNWKMLDSEAKLYSYLSGAYYRKGFRMGEKLYCIYWHNKDNVYNLLEKARCKNILFVSTINDDPNDFRNYYRNPYMFCFEPSVFLRKYLDSYEEDNFYRERIADKERSENEKKIRGERIVRMLEEVFNSWENMLK